MVASLTYLNIIIPHPQQTEAHVTDMNHSDSCGTNILSVSMQDDACGGFYKASNGYSTTGKITNTSKQTITGIQLHFKTYFCDKGSELSSTGSCTNNFKPFNGPIFSLKHGESMSFSTPTLHSSDYGSFNMCGLFQNDFWFSYNNGGCTSTLNGTGTGFGFAGDGYCKLWDGHTLVSSNPWSPKWECTPVTPTPTPTPTETPTPTVTPSVTPSVTPPPPHLIVIKDVSNRHGGTKMSSDFLIHVDGNNPNPSDFVGPDFPFSVAINEGNYSVTEQQLPGYTLVSDEGCHGFINNGQTITCTLVNEDIPASLTLIKVVNNNHGGTKTANDFVLRVNGTQVTNNVSNAEQSGDYFVSEDDMSGYHQVSNSCGDGHIHLNAGENRVCIIMNEDNGSVACTMPTCNTNISGCSYPFPDTKTCSCGPLVCVTNTPSQPNITINNTNTQSQQQQQQQAVLGASVAPASSATKLPATGAGEEVLFGLLGLLPIGLKLRKIV